MTFKVDGSFRKDFSGKIHIFVQRVAQSEPAASN